jgi:hypothetical protein
MSGADDVLNDMYNRYFKEKYESFETNYVELTGAVYDGPFVHYNDKKNDFTHSEFEGCIEIFIQPTMHKGPMFPVRIFCETDEQLMEYEKTININDLVHVKGALDLEGDQASYMFVNASTFKTLKKHMGIV